jgi:protein O-GlcNAc transferase
MVVHGDRERAKERVEVGRERLARGDAAGAETAFLEATQLDGAWSVAHNALGVARVRAGRLAEAERAFAEACRLAPHRSSCWWNLFLARRDRAEVAGALEPLRRAVACPDVDDTVLRPAAEELRRRDHVHEGAALVARQASPSADDAAWAGLELVMRGAPEPGLRLLLSATESFPERADLWYAAGVAAQGIFELSAAEKAYRRCVALDPTNADAWNNLGSVLKKMVRFDEAIAAYEAGIAARPTKLNTYRNLLFALQYDPGRDARAVYEAHRAYGLRFADPMPPAAVEADPERPLRIGYLSADLGTHPVGHFLLPVWQHHDRRRFHITAYAAPRPEDEVTRRLRALADAWVPVGALDDEALAARIRSDGIDILVELGGHTRGTRVQVCARKPAPVQVTWAGYVGTTGLPTIDWLIGDPRHTPEGAEATTVERIWRLPNTYVCWEPPEAPPPGPLPMTRVGYPTLACFNNLPKVNRRVVGLWARILRERPDARLLLVTKALGDARLAATWTSWFAAEGVDPSRIETGGRRPREEVLQAYGTRVDLALDPFPYSGGLTTLEALWMGVPVVTLGGDRFASRHSLGHLGAVGLSSFVAADEEEYLGLVLATLDRPAELAAVRASLRERMLASPLCDGPGFTRDLEAAFRGMWRARCAG